MSSDDHKQALPQGFRLGPYRVARVLGVGGFGVTYLCEHAGLGVQVAVKEYLPNEIAVRDGTEVHPKSAGDREGFEWGLSRFLDEARTLARFEHRNVVRVRDCFETNNTAYIVMDYEDGEPLDALLRRHGTLTEAQLKRVVLPVADGLRQVHGAGFLHRDIKPSNIFVRRSDESPVLLDFGSARQALGHKSRSLTAIASAGYSPPEQYESIGPQGAWTDIYALSALCYRAITGNTPMGATLRQSQLLRTQVDPLPRLAEGPTASYSPTFLEAVDWGLRLIETERPQSLEEWLPQLEGAATVRQSDASDARQARQPASPPTTRRTGAWLALGLFLVVGLVWLASQWDADQATVPPPKAVEQPFTVLVEPPIARVQILNFGSPYLAGMELATGSYEVEASAPGYVTKTETVAHGGVVPTLHRMTLSPLEQSFTVVVEPADARVRILNFGSPYRAGMELPAGSYEVEASAPGYVTKTETVAHGTVPTVHRLALSQLAHPFTVVPELPASSLDDDPGSAARVRLLDHAELYRPGMLLPPGSYKVEVSAEGYETVTESVMHGVKPTERRIVLRKAGLNVGERFRDCAECPEMVVVPAGSYRMGSPSAERGRTEDESTLHEVTILAPFAIGRYEVTVAEFGRFVDGTEILWRSDWCYMREGDRLGERAEVALRQLDRHLREGGAWRGHDDRGWRNPGFGQGDQYPVVCVSWQDATSYAAWLSRQTGEAYRLPSESEWEYAARGGTETARYWGEDESDQCRHANGADASAKEEYSGPRPVASCHDGHVHAAPTGSFMANGWGLHDMLGNVGEWTADCWNDSYAGAPLDGRAWKHGDCSLRVLRGGSWDDPPSDLRAANRFAFATSIFRPDNAKWSWDPENNDPSGRRVDGVSRDGTIVFAKSNVVGFRVVRSLSR